MVARLLSLSNPIPLTTRRFFASGMKKPSTVNASTARLMVRSFPPPRVLHNLPRDGTGVPAGMPRYLALSAILSLLCVIRSLATASALPFFCDLPSCDVLRVSCPQVTLVHRIPSTQIARRRALTLSMRQNVCSCRRVKVRSAVLYCRTIEVMRRLAITLFASYRRLGSPLGKCVSCTRSRPYNVPVVRENRMRTNFSTLSVMC